MNKNSYKKVESKICPVCNFSFNNRKKWKAREIWDKVKYCSDRCRRDSKQ